MRLEKAFASPIRDKAFFTYLAVAVTSSFQAPLGSVVSYISQRLCHFKLKMVFTSPSWVPELPSPPDSVSIPDFMLDEQYGRYPLSKSRDPYTCGLTGKTYTTSQVKERVANLAKALAKELQWEVNTGSEYDKVAGVFCFNTVCDVEQGA